MGARRRRWRSRPASRPSSRRRVGVESRPDGGQPPEIVVAAASRPGKGEERAPGAAAKRSPRTLSRRRRRPVPATPPVPMDKERSPVAASPVAAAPVGRVGAGAVLDAGVGGGAAPGGDVGVVVRSPRADGVGLVRFRVASLGQLAVELAGVQADDTDVVLAVPVDGSTVLADPDELIDAAQLFGGICVAASPVALASPMVARRVEQVVADAAGGPVARCHPYPYALVGAAGPLRSLLADLVEGDSDADRITNAMLSGRHDVILDTICEFFHVLDGTGTDVVVVDGRARAGEERPLVLIDPTADHQALPPVAASPVAAAPVGRVGAGAVLDAAGGGGAAPGGDVGVVVRSPRADGVGLVRFRVASLGQLAVELAGVQADDTDVVLAVPVDGSAVLADPDELIDAAHLCGGICVAASPVALASPMVARRVEQVVADAAGGPVARCHPYPYALVGAAGPLRSLLADLVEGDSDADRITNAMLSGRHDVILDTICEFFHVVDGTGTDVVVVDGRARAGEERPLVLIDPTADHQALPGVGADPTDGPGTARDGLRRVAGAVGEPTTAPDGGGRQPAPLAPLNPVRLRRRDGRSEPPPPRSRASGFDPIR